MDRLEQDARTRKISEEFVAKILVYSTIIDQHLTHMICRQITRQFSNIIDFVEYFDEVAFERKITLVELILKHNYPKLYSEYTDTFVKIKQLKDIRNRIAHHSRSYLYDGQKTSFVLSPIIVKLENNPKGGYIEKNVKKYTVREMNGLIKMAENCEGKVRQVLSKLHKLNYS